MKGANRHPNSLANLKPGRKPGALGRITKERNDLRAQMHQFFTSAAYRKSVIRRILRGDAETLEVHLLKMTYGAPKAMDDDLPMMAPGSSGPQIVFNLPRPPAEYAGRTMVKAAVSMESQS